MPQLSEARQLREQRAQLIHGAQKLLDEPNFSKDTEERFNKLMGDADTLKKRIDILEAPESYSIRGGLFDARRTVEGHESRAAEQAYGKYLCFGAAELDAEERGMLRRDIGEYRDMGTGGGNALQGTGGGYFVPVGFVNDVEVALKFYSNMLRGGVNDPTIMSTATGQPLPYPTSNDTSVLGELLAENTQVSSADVTLGSIVFGAYKFSSKLVKVSLELMRDSAFDLENFLKRQFAERFGRIANQYLTTGTGSDQPQGIVTAAVAGALSVTATGSSGNTGGSETGATSIGSDDLITLEHKIDPLYRPGAKYMFHDSTLKALRLVKDKYGRPLWQSGLATGQPDTINGYEYLVNNDMATIAVSAKTVLFGQMSKFTIRQVKQLSVLRLSERFADYGQVAFIGFARLDSKLLDAGTHPIAYLEQAAS